MKNREKAVLGGRVEVSHGERRSDDRDKPMGYRKRPGLISRRVGGVSGRGVRVEEGVGGPAKAKRWRKDSYLEIHESFERIIKRDEGLTVVLEAALKTAQTRSLWRPFLFSTLRPCSDL